MLKLQTPYLFPGDCAFLLKYTPFAQLSMPGAAAGASGGEKVVRKYPPRRLQNPRRGIILCAFFGQENIGFQLAMLFYLSYWKDTPLRLFKYATFRAGGAWLTAFLLVVLLGGFTARMLRRFNVRAAERLEGLVPPEFIDKRKSGTPCMGGILLIGAVAVATFFWARLGWVSTVLIVSTLLLALIGFADDYIKVTRQDRGGLSGWWKLFFQFLIAGVGLLILSQVPSYGDELYKFYVPFVKKPVIESWWWCFPFAVLVIVGASNAVNLTDGKDGLASGCTIFCSLTYAVFLYLMGNYKFADRFDIPFVNGVAEAGVFAAAVCGACIGFLWHNCYPASMFMGDTGSLPLGGAVGMLAVLARQELLLVVVGGVFVMEIVSVIIQVTSFKLTGRRVFLCTPIHHHFERKGWTETQIVVRFWIISGVLALAALATLKLR